MLTQEAAEVLLGGVAARCFWTFSFLTVPCFITFSAGSERSICLANFFWHFSFLTLRLFTTSSAGFEGSISLANFAHNA